MRVIVAGLLFAVALPETVHAQTTPVAPTPPIPPVSGQTTEAAAPIDLRLPFAFSDDKRDRTEQLFKRRRSGGGIWVVGGGLALIRILASAASSSASAGGTAISVLVGGIPVGIGIGKLTRFSSAREEAVLAEYSRTDQLPYYVEKRIN